MPGRKYSQANTKYRYGFNGKENDNEVKGEGNQQDYGMRIYDPRLGRFLSVDPLTKEYPELTPYQFASNSPIAGVDLDGLEFYFAADGSYLGQSKKGGTQIRVATKYHIIYSVENGKRMSQAIFTEYKDIKQIEFTKNNVGILVGVAHHFSKEANVDFKKLYNKDVSVGSADDVGTNWPVSNPLYNDGEPGVQELMNSDKSTNKLTISLNNGFIQSRLNDANNFISTLFHEKTHIDTEERGVWEHLDVYYKQISHKSWKNTTSDFKDLIVSNIKELLSVAKGGNSQLSAKDNATIKANATKWENAFKTKLKKDYERKRKDIP